MIATEKYIHTKKTFISIGLPVFNGECYLQETLDSILAQSYPDFELIISDNASTDATQEICARYAAKDRRIRYMRQEENLGASKNYNLVYEASLGRYFKWAAHDDVLAPELIEKCVNVLEHDESVILCYSRIKEINEFGKVAKDYPAKPSLFSNNASKRFFECICIPHPQIAVFGLIRSDVLGKTRLIANYASSDRALLGELALRGRFYEIPEYLFYRRDHPKQSYKLFRGRHALKEWYDPKKVSKITFPHWRLLYEHFISIKRVRLSWQERAMCILYLGWWIRLHWKYLASNLLLKEPGQPSISSSSYK